ncbi:flippase [Methanosphaera sp. ISO3-F5]|uniref:flippase n=1 Tax=Methanosphaera sp. ISO3-F5 TaxID=1452353 RepID=UPI002B25ECB7|nr:flippase [Methanosphaera sp. ISO3-F5]WQH64979.1 flippase [Methanosphaera sp. ISO3-F5]
MSTVRTLVKNTSVLFLSQLVSYILAFFYTLYSARYLGTTNFGIISFATAISGLFAIFTDLGLSTLTIREVAKDKSKTGKYLGNHGTIKLILSLITMSALIIFVNVGTFDVVTKNVVYLIGSSVIINAFGGVFTSLFRAYEQMEYQSISEILNASVLFVGILICVFTKQSVIAVSLVYVIASLAVLLYNFVICTRNYGLIHFQTDLKFWKYLILTAYPLAITSIFALISFKMNTILLNMLTTSAVVGEYTAAFNLMQALIFIPTVFSTAVMPIFSKLYVDSREMLAYSYKKSLKYLTIISMPIAMGTTVLSDKIILFIYGSAYVNTIPILELIIWALPAIFLSYILGTSIASINKQHETVKATFICLLFSTFGNYILIQLFNGIGAAMITVLNEVSMVIFYMYIMHKYGYSVPLREILIKPFIASLLMGVVIYFINLELFISVVIGMIVYFMCILIIRTFDKDDMDIIKELLPDKIVDKLNL